MQERLVVAGPWGGKWDTGWVGVELLWAAGLDTDTLQMNPGWVISLQCNSVQSFTA